MSTQQEAKPEQPNSQNSPRDSQHNTDCNAQAVATHRTTSGVVHIEDNTEVWKEYKTLSTNSMFLTLVRAAGLRKLGCMHMPKHTKTHQHPIIVNYFGINADSNRYEQFNHCNVGNVVGDGATAVGGDDGGVVGDGATAVGVGRGTVQVCAASQFAKQAITLVQQVHKPNESTVMLVSWAPPDMFLDQQIVFDCFHTIK
jgi:hypothetical protein